MRRYTIAFPPRQRRSHRLAVQDVALSRRKQGFESPWERQINQALRVNQAGWVQYCWTPSGVVCGMVRMETLYSVFPNPDDLLRLRPEDLAPILLRLALKQLQPSGFWPDAVAQG